MLKLSTFQAVLLTSVLLVDGATYFQMNFVSYTNPNDPGKELPNGFSCLYKLNNKGFDDCNMCHVQFTTFISYLDDSNPFTLASSLFDMPGKNVTYNDTVPATATTTNSRPTTVIISVLHFGCITKNNHVDDCAANGCTPSGVMLMDTFYWDLTKETPGRGNSAQRTQTLTGTVYKTMLNFNYKFYCDGTYGPNCDLKCELSPDFRTYKCNSTINNALYSCGKDNDGQAINCIECAEFSANFSCTKPANNTQPITTVDSSGKKDYRTATIVLGVFLGLAFIVLLVLLALYCFTDIPEKYNPRQRRQLSRTGQNQSQRPLISAHPPMTNAIKNQRNTGDHNNSNGFAKPLPTFSETKVNSNPDPGMARIPRHSIDSDTSIPDPGYSATVRPAPLPPYNHVAPNARPESYPTESRGSRDTSSQGSAPTPTKRSREVQV